MTFLKILPAILSSLLMAAHFSRASMDVLAGLCLVLLFLLLVKKKWLMRVLQVFLF